LRSPTEDARQRRQAQSANPERGGNDLDGELCGVLTAHGLET